MSSEAFSDRHGLRPEEPLIYDAAPDGLRYGLRGVLHGLGYETPTQQRQVLCHAMRIPPDPGAWTEYPNVDMEVNGLIAVEPWFRFFDALERLPRFLTVDAFRHYFNDINELLADQRTGYRFVRQLIERIGTDEFDEAVALARGVLREDRMDEPWRQFERACEFRNQRPPDWSNAIKEAVNSVEAVMQIIYDRPGLTLTSILSDELAGDIPSSIKRVLRGLYGLGSGTTGARHASVGGIEPTGPRAELTIHLAAAMHAYASSELDRKAR